MSSRRSPTTEQRATVNDATKAAAPQPLVSIIIVNWNRLNDVQETIGALDTQEGVTFETIVVDNGSTDGSVAALQSMPSIRFVALDKNYGPARARNVGVDAAVGRFIFFLDSDASLEKDGLAKSVARMEADATLGIIGCRVNNFFSGKIDQWIYAQPMDRFADQEFDTYSFSAAGALVRRDVFEKVGGFWEELFIYNEEVDLSIRVLQKGYRIIYFPDAVVLHRAAESGRTPGAAYWYYQARNWVWVFYRYFPRRYRWKKVSMYIVIYLLKGLASGSLRAIAKGLLAGLQRTDIITRYVPKLDGVTLNTIEKLNRRSTVRFHR